MPVKSIYIFPLYLFIFLSCSRKEKYPSLKFERVTNDKVSVNQPLTRTENFDIADSIHYTGDIKELTELLEMKQFYVERDDRFNIDEMERLWRSFNIFRHTLGQDEFMEWIEATGFLLEITGKASYAEALQAIIENQKYGLTEDVVSLLKTYIYTNNVDHIHVNLYVDSSIEYEHTLGGKVKITLENDSLKSGNVFLKFEMEEKRYIEVFIRIPARAKGAAVTVKNVKYVAPPGEYCQIAKKWKNGDIVEIVLPAN